MTERTRETDREPSTSSTVIPFEPRAAYALGYADGRRLLSDQPDASLRLARQRFLAHAEALNPTAAEVAYLAGFRDAAADNLPSPPDESYRSAA